MGKILKNLRPYWKSVILILIFLICQAYCDMSLPQYTSNIIDVGIQNKGIEHILPQETTSDEYEAAQIFMTDDEREIWESAYEKSGDNYVLTITDADKLDELDDILLQPIVLTYELGHTSVDSFKDLVKKSLEANPNTAVFASRIDDMSIDEIGAFMHFDIDTFTAEDENGEEATYVDMRPIMQQMIASGAMDSNAVEDAKKQLNETYETIGSSTLKSMGVAYASYCDENAGVDVTHIQKSYLLHTGGKMMLMALGMCACAIIVGFIASRAAAGVGRDLRHNVFGNVMSFSSREMDKFSTSSLITRCTNDIQQIQLVTVLVLRMLIYAPILAIWGIVKVTQTKAHMSWIIALAIVVILCFILLLMAIAMPKFKKMQKLVDNVNRVSREILTGLSVIRAFGREKKEEDRFDDANTELKKTQLFANRCMTFMMPGMQFIMYGLTVLIVWVGAHKINAGNLQVGAMTAFLTYAMVIVMAFLMLTSMAIFLPRAGVAAVRIDEVIKTKSSIENAEKTEDIPEGKQSLVYDHVSFRYPGAEEDVIHDISFTAKPGETTAIIGSTGSGKSTLINLISRFYDVTDGRITYGGKDLRDVKIEDLRDRIGFVPQKGILFSGTIESNIKFGAEDASEEEMKRAAEIAQATDFIEEKEDGYKSHIAQGGDNVSGGQKQRLSIARAIAKNPDILVFDDSFSALDMKTDAALRKALAEQNKDSIKVIVAQRISTILHADQILVLDEGKLVGAGTHYELIKNCKVYREIAESQLSKSEIGEVE